MSSAPSPALRMTDVWKAYPRRTERARSLRGLLAGGRSRPARDGELWAMAGVSLELGPGEALGVIGANGAGKSTLLRLAAGLGRPTRGTIDATLDRAAVLSLGNAFDIELSGAENAVTTAMVLGVARAQAARMLPAILEFAELEQFAHAPVRTYSEGMKLRLAFGVVAQLEPRLLVLDEVLAVGDVRFQRRCLQRVRELREQGMALLFASHELDQVAAECERAVWLHAGAVRAAGAADDVIARYRQAMHSATVAATPAGPAEDGLELRRNRFGSQEARIRDVRLLDRHGVPTDALATGARLVVEFAVEPARIASEAILVVGVSRASDDVLCWQAVVHGAPSRARDARGLSARVEVPTLPLVPGDYRVSLGAYAPDWSHAYDYHWSTYPLQVTGPEEDGVLSAPAEWTFGREG